MSKLSFRDSLKAASTKNLKKSMEDEESKLPSGGGSSDFLKLSEGINKVRIFPPYPGDDTFLTLRCSAWLAVENEDGKPGRRTFQNAKIHAGTKHDILEEYINLSKAKLSASKDKEEIQKLTNMTKYAEGNQASLGYNTSWLMYVRMGKDEAVKRGLLEIKKMVRDAIKTESIIDDEDEAIELDPFTDPETGKPALITYHKKPAKNEKHYKLQLSKNALPLTEEDVDWFEKQKPLSQLTMLKVKADDYDKILDALRNYDDEYEIGVYETPEFEEMVELCRTELENALEGAGEADEDDEDNDDEEAEVPVKKVVAKKTAPKKVEEPEDDEDLDGNDDEDSDTLGDKFDSMDREELKVYNKEKGFGIPVLKGKTTDDDLRESIRAKEAESNKKSSKKAAPKKIEAVVEEDDSEDDAEEAEEEVKVTPKKKPNLLELKDKLKKNGK